MNEFWKLAEDPSTDPVLLRVYRWFMQWPESVAFATMIDPAEISRATGISMEAIGSTLQDMAAGGYLTVHAERPDGVKWITFALNRPGTSLVGPVSERRPAAPREQRRSVSLRLRWKVLERDGRRCRACGAGVEDGAKLVIDHVKPFSKGGLTTEGNLQVLCHDCNAGKCDLWLERA